MTADELLRQVIAGDLAVRAGVCTVLLAALDRDTGPTASDLQSLSTDELRAVLHGLSLHRLLTERRDLVKQLAPKSEINPLIGRLTQFAQAGNALLPARLFH
jgi:hypothetical protein